MKIALVCPYNMLELSGGVSEVVTHLRDELVKRGHEVKIITPRPAGFKGKLPKDYIFLGTSAKFNAGLATDGTWTYDIEAEEISRVLNSEKFDVINFHEPWAPILARQILALSDTAHVGTFHANLVDSVAAKSLVNVFFTYGKGIGDKLDIITAVSPAPAAVFLNKAPDHRLAKSIRYVPNGIDLSKYRTRPASAVKNPKQKTILYVGRLEGRKGVKYLIKAYHELTSKKDDVQLLIAGAGPDEDKLRQYVKDNEIPRVTFLGRISEADKIRHLHKADIACYPSHRGESFGIVLLEAMAAGLPTVAGDNLGYQSVMTGLGALSLVNPQDIIDFSRRLEVFLYQPELRKIWIDWAEKYVEQFDWPKVAQMYEQAYEKAIARHEKIHAKAS
ncbi:MAG TPA: glycosyltransferase family 4 protein [Candidatus Binatia bacterium]|nr:glycosyltransferase family 4 protein [Candidatus Binatia bacterium]